jgi:hypothetical protein
MERTPARDIYRLNPGFFLIPEEEGEGGGAGEGIHESPTRTI